MNDPKEYINDVAYNVKNAFSLNDDLDKIIESEFEDAIKSLHKFGIIEHIERKYDINYIEPELEIVEDGHIYVAMYSDSENKIIFSKESIEGSIDSQLEFLSHKEIERSISDIQDIEYLNKSYNSLLLYPFYINKRNIREAIAESIIRSTMHHELWHSIDDIILDKLEKDPTIKGRDCLLAILNDYDNPELRASAFEVVIYYLVNGFHKNEKGHMAAYKNIPECRNYIEKIDIMKKGGIDIEFRIPYDLGYCYGNIIVAKYKSSLEENIYKIIEDILHLDEKRSIEVIKYYGDNPDKLLQD